jgi:hypothetical protein
MLPSGYVYVREVVGTAVAGKNEWATSSGDFVPPGAGVAVLGEDSLWRVISHLANVRLMWEMNPGAEAAYHDANRLASECPRDEMFRDLVGRGALGYAPSAGRVAFRRAEAA